MKHGFLKVAAITPDIRVADTIYNTDQICEKIGEAVSAGAKVLVFPELCISGYTCNDLFLQETLLFSCRQQLKRIAEQTRGKDALVFVGLPLEREGKLYNVAAALSDGKVLAFIPKMFIPSYGEFYETRHFLPGNEKALLHVPEAFVFQRSRNHFFYKMLCDTNRPSGAGNIPALNSIPKNQFPGKANWKQRIRLY